MKSSESTDQEQETIDPAKILAEKLRQGREEIHYSVDRVAIATKISRAFIGALESGELDQLPEEVFARGFIRNLSKIYELDEKILLSLFDEALGQNDNGRDPEVLSKYPSGRRRKSVAQRGKIFAKRNKLLPKFLGTLLVGLVIGVGLVGWFRYKNTPIGAVSSISKVEVPPPSIVESLESVEDSMEATETEVVNHRKPQESSKLEGGTQEVEVKVLKQARLRISKDNGAAFTEELSPDSYKYRFQDELRMFVYDSASIEISFNGQSVGKIGDQGEYSRLGFKVGPAQLGTDAR